MKDKVRQNYCSDNLDEFLQKEILKQREMRENIDSELNDINLRNINLEGILNNGEKPFYKIKEFLNKEIEIPTSVVAGIFIIILTSSLIFNIASIKVNAEEISRSKINVVILEGDIDEKNKN